MALVRSTLLLYVFIFGFQNIAAQGSCSDPNTQCIGLPSCAPLYAILQKSGSMTAQERTYLQNSQCGYVPNQNLVMVCCPRSTNTRTAPQPATSPVGMVNRMSGLLPRTPNCGKQITNRIVGGEETQIDEFPWLAQVEYTKPDGVKERRCGGTLISNRYVLTAAHCVSGPGVPKDWRLTGVRLGEWDQTTNPDFTTDARGRREYVDAYVDVSVEEAISHPRYAASAKNQLHDISLLRLARSVTFTDYIQPVCLPTTNTFGAASHSGVEMEVAGWGWTESNRASDVKLKAYVTVWNMNECITNYGRSRLILENSQMCAGGQKGVDSCRGDSGGPLMVQEMIQGVPHYFLAGVVSFGPTPCGLQGWPGVYTRVGFYLNWIESTMRA